MIVAEDYITRSQIPPTAISGTVQSVSRRYIADTIISRVYYPYEGGRGGQMIRRPN